jgi:hypothetical protein
MYICLSSLSQRKEGCISAAASDDLLYTLWYIEIYIMFCVNQTPNCFTTCISFITLRITRTQYGSCNSDIIQTEFFVHLVPIKIYIFYWYRMNFITGYIVSFSLPGMAGYILPLDPSPKQSTCCTYQGTFSHWIHPYTIYLFALTLGIFFH